jgi:hypothetical protein
MHSWHVSPDSMIEVGPPCRYPTFFGPTLVFFALVNRSRPSSVQFKAAPEVEIRLTAIIESK